ncbi:hypothetical protein [Halomicrococcus sp. SG-WS-1]
MVASSVGGGLNLRTAEIEGRETSDADPAVEDELLALLVEVV